MRIIWDKSGKDTSCGFTLRESRAIRDEMFGENLHIAPSATSGVGTDLLEERKVL